MFLCKYISAFKTNVKRQEKNKEARPCDGLAFVFAGWALLLRPTDSGGTFVQNVLSNSLTFAFRSKVNLLLISQRWEKVSGY
jgi:hypothetical protein